MAILMIHEAPGGTQEQYEQVAARLAAGGSFDSPGDWPVSGLLFHAAGPTDDGWRVVDVWESEEAFQNFGPLMGPVLQEVGFPGEPKCFLFTTSFSRRRPVKPHQPSSPSDTSSRP